MISPIIQSLHCISLRCCVPTKKKWYQRSRQDSATNRQSAVLQHLPDMNCFVVRTLLTVLAQETRRFNMIRSNNESRLTYKIQRCNTRRHNSLHTSRASRWVGPSIPACVPREPWWKGEATAALTDRWCLLDNEHTGCWAEGPRKTVIHDATRFYVSITLTPQIQRLIGVWKRYNRHATAVSSA